MKKGEAKSYSKNVYTVIDVPTREEGGKQITVKNRADPQEDFLQVAEGGSGRRRSQCQGDGRGEGQTKGKREKGWGGEVGDVQGGTHFACGPAQG